MTHVLMYFTFIQEMYDCASHRWIWYIPLLFVIVSSSGRQRSKGIDLILHIQAFQINPVLKYHLSGSQFRTFSSENILHYVCYLQHFIGYVYICIYFIFGQSDFRKRPSYHQLPNHQKADLNNCEVLLSCGLKSSPPLLNIENSCWQQTLKCWFMITPT